MNRHFDKWTVADSKTSSLVGVLAPVTPRLYEFFSTAHIAAPYYAPSCKNNSTVMFNLPQNFVRSLLSTGLASWSHNFANYG